MSRIMIGAVSKAKSKAAKRFLKLMDSDEDIDYTEAMKITLAEFPKVKKRSLEKELDNWV